MKIIQERNEVIISDNLPLFTRFLLLALCIIHIFHSYHEIVLDCKDNNLALQLKKQLKKSLY